MNDSCSRWWPLFKQYAVLLETPTSPLLDFSAKNISAYTRINTHILNDPCLGVVSERRMGFFRNTAPSLVLIVPIRNIKDVTVVFHEAV